MAKLEVSSIHEHPLLPFTRFVNDRCKGCGLTDYIYGGYCCNELGCRAVFHKECAEALPEIYHSSHPDSNHKHGVCSICFEWVFFFGYSCSICDFILDVHCATTVNPLPIVESSSTHEHPLELCPSSKFVVDDDPATSFCKVCDSQFSYSPYKYTCVQCNLSFHVVCVSSLIMEYHTFHPKHTLKFIVCEPVPSYADKECILCGRGLDEEGFEHCDICNFTICRCCGNNPPPLGVVSLTTHEHQLHLVPRLIEFTCNACGKTGDRSPYFCLQCNFMVHRECIDLPRVININRHDHRISYAPRLGHGDWKCKVCRKTMDGFYGAYTCSKCPTFAAHARCATRRDVWEWSNWKGHLKKKRKLHHSK